MNITLLASLFRERARLHSHERWSRRAHCVPVAEARGAARVRGARSPFYAEFHRGLDNAPLEALPTVSKAQLMERFDDFVTDRGVRLADVERHLEAAAVTDSYLGRYRVAATGGTTGRRGVFLADAHE